MKTDYDASAKSSGTTSASGPNPSNNPDPDAPAASLTEAEFLAQQAHNAQLAMSRVLQDLKSKLGQGVDPKAWAKEHPWVAVGAAALAGFAATAALVPSKEEQALKKLASIERALNPAPERPASNGSGGHAKDGLMGTILKEVLGMVKPVLASIVAANLGGVLPPDAGPDGRRGGEQGGAGV
jgi:hypothetical protein